MPVKDALHDRFVRALIKAGWEILREQVPVKIRKRLLWIDAYAIKDDLAILVEVKSFAYGGSDVDYLASVIGKYLLYQAILHYLDNKTPLYLAVPKAAYDGILSEPIGQQVVRKAGIKLIVIDPESEEVIRWAV